MSRRFNAAFVSAVLALSGVVGACATPAEEDMGPVSSGGGAGTPGPTGGTGVAAGGASGGGAGSTSSGGGAGKAGGGAGAAAGAGGGDVGGAMAGGAGGAAGLGGAGGLGGEGGAGGVAGGAAGSMAVMREDLGEGDGTDVVTIGDSFMNLSLGSGIEYSLDKITPTMYRHYGVPGTQILNGQIPGQWTQAKNADPDVSTVIMTGGGNDIILDFFGNLVACAGAKTEADLSDACITALDEITAGVTELENTMMADGVKDLIYVGYGYVTTNELGGTIERTKRVQNEQCRDDDPTKTMRCHFVDPSMQLIGKISGDGIHPTVAGYDMIADMVWKRMQEEGVRR